MSITSATLADIPALVALVNSAYRGIDGQRGWTNEAHLISGARTKAADLEELLQTPGARLFKYTGDDGRVCGCVFFELQDAKLYLGMLSVDPSQQNTGIGKQFLAFADDYARLNHCNKINITVISVRPELVAWYERHGYYRTGEIRPFHAGDRFGQQKQALELAVLEKPIPA